MDLTRKYMDDMHALMKAYDAEQDIEQRAALGKKLDEMANFLSDGQIKQVCKSYHW